MFMAAPTLFLNFLLLSLDGRPRDFVGMSLVGFVIGLMGIGVGFLVKFLYKKYRA